MFMTWFMFSCNYYCLGMSQRANIRNMNSLVVKHYVEYKKDNIEYGFLKPEYSFKSLFTQINQSLLSINLFFISNSSLINSWSGWAGVI